MFLCKSKDCPLLLLTCPSRPWLSQQRERGCTPAGGRAHTPGVIEGGWEAHHRQQGCQLKCVCVSGGVSFLMHYASCSARTATAADPALKAMQVIDPEKCHTSMLWNGLAQKNGSEWQTTMAGSAFSEGTTERTLDPSRGNFTRSSQEFMLVRLVQPLKRSHGSLPLPHLAASKRS